MRKRQRQNLLPHSASLIDDRTTEYPPTVIPLLFFRAPKLLTIDYNEFFDATTEDPPDLLTSAPADGLLSRNLWLPTKTFATWAVELFLKAKYCEMFSHYYIYMCAWGHVCAQSYSLVIVQLSCMPAPSLPRLQKIREPKEWGAFQVPARCLFVSFYLIYGSKSRAVPSMQK